LLVAFVAAAVSQVPKRFVYRSRPCLAKPPRAIKLSNEKTSSFPSRAVLCTTVYVYLIVACSNFEYSSTYAGIFSANFSLLKWYWVVLIVVVASIVACLARIYLGVHYPSDCVAGLVLACFILLLSAGIYQIPFFNCKSCTDACHSDNHIDNIGQLNWLPIAVVFFVGTLISFFITMKPVAFWKKNAYVFGTSLALILFRISLLCPTSGHSQAVSKVEREWYYYLVAAAVFLVSLCFAAVVAMLKDKPNLGKRSTTWNLMFYFAICGLTYAWLAAWRLSIVH